MNSLIEHMTKVSTKINAKIIKMFSYVTQIDWFFVLYYPFV